MLSWGTAVVVLKILKMELMESLVRKTYDLRFYGCKEASRFDEIKIVGMLVTRANTPSRSLSLSLAAATLRAAFASAILNIHFPSTEHLPTILITECDNQALLEHTATTKLPTPERSNLRN
jgi:hypothetical protein